MRKTLSCVSLLWTHMCISNNPTEKKENFFFVVFDLLSVVIDDRNGSILSNILRPLNALCFFSLWRLIGCLLWAILVTSIWIECHTRKYFANLHSRSQDTVAYECRHTSILMLNYYFNYNTNLQIFREKKMQNWETKTLARNALYPMCMKHWSIRITASSCSCK